jgi:ubiquinol-cytochrome c reductase cytochrome b subunit
METFLVLVLPVILIAILILLPFYSGTGEKSYRRRTFAVVIVMLALLTVGLLAYSGTFTPWSPHMEAWSDAPTPAAELQGRTPLQLQGAILIQSKQCRNCHALGGAGGLRGPALDTVASLLTGDQLSGRIQGSGNIRHTEITPAMTALVAFMKRCGPRISPLQRLSKH